MEPIYARIRERARKIVSRFPTPDFYKDFPQANEFSQQFFETDPLIVELRIFIAEHLEDDFGHGFEHASKVAKDAGTLIYIEGNLAGYSDNVITRRLLIVQCAGLFHDTKRKQKNHALKSAFFSEEVLKSYSLLHDEIKDISHAIQNHEAFKTNFESNTPEDTLTSDCLYDADKFRWGPDNFYYTVWDMVSFYKTPFSKFMHLYPKGMDTLHKIKNTFRTNTGKKYGPQFIEIGIAIGEELFDVINNEFAHLLKED
ncbi:MAG: hypothetical protein JRE28_15345 [Deltaproteobacteria bacterium]|nr:hypothetical protein [Deltaproteobacteria bacterium]